VNEQTSAGVHRQPAVLGAALVYFAKVPRPGQVKTRLCPPLTLDEAAALYGAFLRATVVAHHGTTTYLFGTPAAGLDELAGMVAAHVVVRPQVGPDLWARLVACFAELFAAGHDRVVVRNTDSPDLPRARVDEALAACAPGRVVLGPDTGGGYYLIGLGAPAPALFQLGEVAAAEVYARTCVRAAELGLEVVRLLPERDVDTYDDLLALWAARLSRERDLPPTGK